MADINSSEAIQGIQHLQKFCDTWKLAENDAAPHGMSDVLARLCQNAPDGALDPEKFLNALSSIGQWEGALASWWGVWITALGVLVTFGGFIFVFFQLRGERLALETQTSWTMYEASLSVLNTFVEEPTLRPYFYDNQPLPDADPLRSQVLATAEIIADHLENIVSSGKSKAISTETYYVWVCYMYMLGERSQVMKYFLSDAPHPDIDRARKGWGEGRRYDDVFRNIVLHGIVPEVCAKVHGAENNPLPGLKLGKAA